MTLDGDNYIRSTDTLAERMMEAERPIVFVTAGTGDALAEAYTDLRRSSLLRRRHGQEPWAFTLLSKAMLDRAPATVERLQAVRLAYAGAA